MDNTVDTEAQPSDFVQAFSSVIRSGDMISVEQDFRDLQEVYVSDHGHTRVLTATRYGKRYALKCLKQDCLLVPLYRQMLGKEFEIGLRLDHPNICRTVGMEEVSGLGPTIIMELVDGITLQDLMRSRQLTAALAHKVAGQLMDALRYMHSKQIFHRDLKPSNIMITHLGHDVKVIDFSLSDSENFAVLKSPAGTMGYVAPEQLHDEGPADARADIYSLGRVLGDMARVTGDRRLRRMSAVCAQADPQRRPASIDGIAPMVRRKYDRVWVVFLALVCLFLLGLVVAGLVRRRTAVTVPAATAVPGVSVRDNQVMDYKSWPGQDRGVAGE